MKAKLRTTKNVNAKYLGISIPIRYEEEDMPNDFPLREGDNWSVKIDIDTGTILDWINDGVDREFCAKVVDSGIYIILDEKMKVLSTLEDYVPNGIVPGEYGDYVELKISKNGVITNWPKNPDISEFLGFENQEEY